MNTKHSHGVNCRDQRHDAVAALDAFLNARLQLDVAWWDTKKAVKLYLAQLPDTDIDSASVRILRLLETREEVVAA